MAQRDADRVPQNTAWVLFRLPGNSPSAQHLTHKVLLCWIFYIIADFFRKGKAFLIFLGSGEQKMGQSQKINTLSVAKTAPVCYNKR